MFVFDNIVIVHVINFRKERGVVNPLREFKRDCQPFSPMSCMRHVHIIYLDSVEKDKAIRKFIETVSPTSDVAEVLSAKDAYEFMLKWATGSISRKLFGNDHFVLGTIRSEWAKFIKHHNLISECFMPFMKSILADAKKIRSYANSVMVEILKERRSLVDATGASSAPDVMAIEDATLTGEEEASKAESLSAPTEQAHRLAFRKMLHLIRNCVATREIGFEPEYPVLDTTSTKEYMMALASARSKSIGKELRSSQARCAKDVVDLKPSALNPDKDLVALSIMNKTVLLMQQRHTLTLAASEYDDDVDASILSPLARPPSRVPD